MPDTPTAPGAANTGIGGIIGQILDLVQGAQGRDLNRGSTAANIADPFSGQRGQYQDSLSKILGLGMDRPGYTSTFAEKEFDPGTYAESPGYKWGLNQGLEGVNRAGNAMFGTTRAGNTAATLVDYATGAAQADYDKWRDDATKNRQIFNQEQDARRNADVQRNQLFDQRGNSIIDALLTASGAKTGNPAAAAQAYLGGFENQDKRLASGLSGGLIDNVLGLLGKGVGSINWASIFGNTQGANGITNSPGDGTQDNIDVGGGWNPGSPLPGYDLPPDFDWNN